MSTRSKLVSNWLRVLVLFVILLPLIATPGPSHAQQGEQCFAETGICVSGRILQYWQQNGGLPVFGLPITPQRQETIGDWTGQVQWFERNRLESHPGNQPPYDVLLGRLGSMFVERDGGPPPREAPREGCTYFEQTGYNVCGDFLNYWRSHGLNLDGQPGFTPEENLALFGFPLTGEFEATMENGSTRIVQWFERARFERHPENNPPYNVLLTRLGVAEVGAPVPPPPDPSVPVPAVPSSPHEPTPEERAAIERVARAHIDRHSVVNYTLQNMCVDRNFAHANVIPDDPMATDPTHVILQKQNNRWRVIHFGPFIPMVAFFNHLGLPLDFACITPVDL